MAKRRETRDPRPSREERQLNRELQQAISASTQETASNKGVLLSTSDAIKLEFIMAKIVVANISQLGFLSVPLIIVH